MNPSIPFFSRRILLSLAAVLFPAFLWAVPPAPLLQLAADGSLANSGSLGGNFAFISGAAYGEGLNGTGNGFDLSFASDHGDGSGGAVSYASNASLDGLSSFTIAVWARPDGVFADNEATLAARAGAYGFGFSAAGDQLKLTVDNSSRSDASGNDFIFSETDAGLQASEGWVFYVVQWRASDGQVQFYYAQEGDTELTLLGTSGGFALNKAQTDASASSLVFGNDNATALAYDGWLDNCRFYGVASGDTAFLSSGDLEAIFMEGVDSSGVVYPADAGLLDVTQAPYNAVGDGVTDDTAAFQAAILDAASASGNTAPQFIYVPNGVYRITDSLEAIDPLLSGWQETPRLAIIGQSKEHVTLRLDDSAAGFNDPLNPKAVLYYGGDAVGNGSFGNYLRNVTIETGSGNSGAIGLDFLTSNYGSVNDVRILSGDGAGFAGINASRNYQGPGLIKNVTVDGFNTGIRFANSNYHMTLEHISVSNQASEGLYAAGLTLAIRGLVSDNTVPALRVEEITSLVSLVEATLSNGSGSNDAIELTGGAIYARDVNITGYANAIDDKGTLVAGPAVSSWSSPEGRHDTFVSPAEHLELPIKEHPVFHEKNLDMWVNVQDFGANPEDSIDDSAAIQSAIDFAEANGKTVVYFPIADKAYNKPAYRLLAPITVGGSVKKLEGFLQRIEIYPSATFDVHEPKSVVTFEQSDHDTVYAENFWLGNRTRYFHFMVEHAGTQNLAFRSGAVAGFINNPGVGELYAEDLIAGNYFLIHPQNMWARQFDAESFYTRKLVNNGGDVWILGLKTERMSTIAQTYSSGRSEFLGQYSLGQWDSSDDRPVFLTVDSALSTTFKNSGQSGERFSIIATEERAGVLDSISYDEIPGRESPASILTSYPAGFTPSTDPFVSVYATQPDIVENTAGDGEFTFRRSGSTASGLTVNYTVEGDAAAGSDYTALSGSVTFGVGESEKTVPVSGLNDGGVEAPEVVKVVLSGGAGWDAGFPKEATVTIADDDQPAAGIPTDMAYWFDAERSVRRGPDDRSRFWEDLSGNGNHMRGFGPDLPGNNFHPMWIADDGEGVPAVSFESDLLQVFRDDTILFNTTKTTKNIFIKFRTGPDVTDRQVIFEHGHFPGSGLTLYLDDGHLYFLGTGSEASPSWARTYVNAPVSPNAMYVAELVFDQPSGRMEIYLHRNLLSGAPAGGTIGTLASSYDFSHFGGVVESISFHDLLLEFGRPDFTFTGLIYSAVEYNRLLSPVEREAINTYMDALTYYEVDLVTTGETLLYFPGETVVFEAPIAAPEQQFSTWTGDTVYMTDPTSRFQSFVMPEADISFTATYETLVPSGSALDAAYDTPDDITWADRSDFVVTISDASARGGDYQRLNSNTVGDFLTYEVSVPANDEYEIRLGYTGGGGSLYAIMQLKINGVLVGNTLDQAAGTGFLEHNFGTVGLEEGTHTLRFEVIGENNPQNFYLINFDYIDLKAVSIGPDAPTALSATAVSGTQIDLAWTDNSGDETGFKIQRSATSGSGFTTIFVTTANVSTYSDTGLQPGSTLYYQIRATNASGDSNPSDEALDTTWTYGEVWRDQFFGQTANSGNAADGFDFDNDGLVNLLERAFKTVPTSGGSAFRPSISVVNVGGIDYPALTYRRIEGGSGTSGVDYAAEGISYAVEYDLDLIDPWNSGSVSLFGSPSANGDGTETVTVRSLTPIDTESEQFMRLSVTAP